MKWTIFSLLFFLSCNVDTDKSPLNTTSSENFLLNKGTHELQTFDQNHNLISSVDIKKYPKKVAIFSTTHFGFIDALGLKNAVKWVSKKSYFYSEYISSESVTEVGTIDNLNIEKLIIQKPDLVLLNPLPPNKTQILKSLTKANIPYLITTEHLENHPLAQAEWIKIFGYIFNKSKKADSIFHIVKTNYNKTISNDSFRPKVMTSFPWNNQWYVSGSNSNFATLLYDAGGQYIIKKHNLPQNPISLEKAYNYLNEADIWLNVGTITSKKQILTNIKNADNFPSVKNKRLFNNNNRVNQFGANDVWESGIVRPDILLQDLKFIIQSRDSGLVYYRKIK